MLCTTPHGVCCASEVVGSALIFSVPVMQKETDAPKGKKTKPKRGAKAATRRRGTGNPATDPGPPVNGALKRIDQWPGLEDDSLVRTYQAYRNTKAAAGRHAVHAL